MNAFGGLFGDPILGVTALVALAVIGYLGGQALAELHLQRTERRQRVRARQDFRRYE